MLEILSNWKAVVVIVVGVAFGIILMLGIYAWFSGTMFNENPVKEWTMQEAVFYEFSLLAFVHFIRG
jgi:hypothetical protein